MLKIDRLPIDSILEDNKTTTGDLLNVNQVVFNFQTPLTDNQFRYVILGCTIFCNNELSEKVRKGQCKRTRQDIEDENGLSLR